MFILRKKVFNTKFSRGASYENGNRYICFVAFGISCVFLFFFYRCLFSRICCCGFFVLNFTIFHVVTFVICENACGFYILTKGE